MKEIRGRREDEIVLHIEDILLGASYYKRVSIYATLLIRAARDGGISKSIILSAVNNFFDIVPRCNIWN